ncbi:response regulator [Fulvivirga sp. M361]|uniref:LytR/AlgR family response regulator transcription factor n=1 Tax=Fulvivirga sp. M361 TaxID=2594266 RepID=UPI00117AA127|nr:LytTR family transcriptional regulator DNA-binding domain-containing protein [Fulvivirga sp. M361]TRX62669.1 response regulator [Fulvivirga sp. M361]
MIKVLIIDDEKLARDVVKAYLKEHADLQVTGECANGFEGVKYIHEHKPDLLFLDIQMPKLTGFELLELLEDPPAIIFSTAYDEFAIRAFEKNAADYLLKPYSQIRFNEALKKARLKIGSDNNELSPVNGLVESHRETTDQLDRIVIRTGSKIVILGVDQIEYFEAQDDYVAIYSEGKKYLKQVRMKYLESSLPTHRFVRVHRSYIIAVEQIDKIEAYTKDSYLAMLKDGKKIPVSRSGYQVLKEVLKF